MKKRTNPILSLLATSSFFFMHHFASANLCQHIIGDQQKKIAQFVEENPVIDSKFECRFKPTPNEMLGYPQGSPMTDQTINAFKNSLKSGTSFALIEGESALRLGSSHKKITGHQAVVTAGDIKLIFSESDNEIAEAWFNVQAGGYFGNSAFSLGIPISQEKVIGSLEHAVRALWKNNIYPKKIKFFFFSNDTPSMKAKEENIDSRFSELVFET